MKLLPNDSGENGVSIAVPKWGLGQNYLGAKNYTVRAFACTGTGAAAWRMTQN